MAVPGPACTPGDTSWFTHDRFGLFIHWGLYSLGARHEWLQSHEKMTTEQYRSYFKRFDPDLYDPRTWARMASRAGMKYFVVTTKHHDGFCLWDSKLTDYKTTATPCGKDLIAPMVDAFREENMKVGFYHSLLDWHHPEYTLDWAHPMRDDREYAAADSSRKWDTYVSYLHGQVEELMTRFGTVDILWFDFSFPERDGFPGKGREQWRGDELIRLVRTHQPNIILNDRLQIDQDVKTPEQFMPREWVKVNGRPVVWEACHTFGGSWGYCRDERNWKSVEQLIGLLIESVSKGGNLLLNVGPTGRGEFDERTMERLEGIGEWVKRHGRSIYGCTQAPSDYIPPKGCLFTFNPEKNVLYLHVMSWPFRQLHLDGLGGKVEYAQLLNDASEVGMIQKEIRPEDADHMGEARDADLLTLELPVEKPRVAVPVIELFLK